MVKALATSRKVKAADAAGSCTEVNTIAIELTSLVLVFPGSPDVLVISATIIASSSVVCTDDEKAALAEVESAFGDALAQLDEALEAAQSSLMTLTGATASPEEIAEVVAATTVAAGDTTVIIQPISTMAGGITIPGTTAASGDTTAASGDTTAASGGGLYVYL